MQRITAPIISSAEWRWVIIFSGLLVAITLIPYAWAFASDSPNNDWQFMGMLANPLDSATYLAKINEGQRGAWIFTLPYTPEVHSGATINEFYLFLGHVASILNLSSLLIYHIARLVTGFIMYISIYYLGAVIWPRLRPRRLFFTFIGVGSGLGWLWIIFVSQMGGFANPMSLPTDLTVPESIPFFATFVNPHFPLAIALIAFLAASFIIVFRPGFAAQPTLQNGGLGVALLSIALCIVQPQGWVPIAVSLCLYVAILAWRTRRIPNLELNWVLMVILPAVPFFIYYVAVVTQNDAMRKWNAQNITPSPSPLYYVLGFGLLLLVAVPGIWRGIRRFERDGDRFMLIWLIVNAVALYVPLSLQRRFAIGLIIPIVYFAVRALEDYWLHRISPKWQDASLVALIVFMVPSNILSLGIPLFGVVANPQAGLTNNLNLSSGYFQAITWLREEGIPDQVVLALPQPSLWIPAYSTDRVVYGHPFETLDATQKRQEVTGWYQGMGCTELIQNYHVRYILFRSTSEDGLTISNACLTRLNLNKPLATFGDVALYEVQ